MGIPETILYKTEEEALHMFKIGFMSEPEPGDESVIMTNETVKVFKSTLN